jgi:hypothetical protein
LISRKFSHLLKEKSANQKQELPVVAMFVNGSGQNVQYLEKIDLAIQFQRRRIFKISQSETRVTCDMAATGNSCF